MSPGTSSAASMVCSFPSRRTVAVGDTNSISDSTALFAWYSCQKPTVPFTASTMEMTITSDHLASTAVMTSAASNT